MDTSSACIANIGPRERRRRVVSGLLMILLTLAAAGWLWAADAPRLLRIVVFIPAWMAALGFFQARAKTCVMLAARGARNMDGGNETIADPRELTQVRAQARRVYLQSVLVAAAVTILVVVLPG